MLSGLHPPTMDDVVLYAVANDPLVSPPTVLRNLQLINRKFRAMLNPHDNPRVHAQLFALKFDTAATTRRLPPDASLPIHLACELRTRFSALKCFRRHDIYDPVLPHAFLVAYIMLLEDDGKNIAHLEAAGLPALVEEYLIGRLHEGADEANGWPASTEMNSLAVTLFWQLTAQQGIVTESVDRRHSVVALLKPYALVGFRYPFLDASVDPMAVLGVNSTHHTPPVSAAPRRTIQYLGQELELHLPPISWHAMLSYFARLEMGKLVHAMQLPASRAVHPGPGMTVEDIDEYNTYCRTRAVPRCTVPGEPHLTRSRRHDPDWARALAPAPAHGLTPPPAGSYVPGVLTGNWQGTLLIPSMQEYAALQQGAWSDDALKYLARWPLFVTLEEHYRYADPMSTPKGDDWDDDSYLPLQSTWLPREDGMELYDPKSSHKVFYKTLMKERHDDAPKNIEPGFAPSGDKGKNANAGIVDVILSGTTQEHHGMAWGSYKFKGRVRLSDGLVVLAREPTDPRSGLGRALFIGYVLSGQNFVGRWRVPTDSSSASSAPYEGIWSLCKQA
ncbi:hypothetical protein FA95DRAFT_1604703 [Auriscalpium vulgare]|uniref:Uncharacterized protein n=1 Tax=Auriscalpium vulgare TaxID=40419 RepID=A0ACB8RYT5_9AGAM|nr:hypothetical protein FA95DRAFT_1604703 [Auriscalpium vulgare]